MKAINSNICIYILYTVMYDIHHRQNKVDYVSPKRIRDGVLYYTYMYINFITSDLLISSQNKVNYNYITVLRVIRCNISFYII